MSLIGDLIVPRLAPINIWVDNHTLDISTYRLDLAWIGNLKRTLTTQRNGIH